MPATLGNHVKFLINILCLAAAMLPALIIAERLLAAAAATAACTPLAASIEKDSCNPPGTVAKQDAVHSLQPL